jgi:hypothetical protein
MLATSASGCFLEHVTTIFVSVPSHCSIKSFSPNHLYTGSFWAIVTNGVTLGHSCCKVHNCTNPLPNNCAHFCSNHLSLWAQCVITGCDQKAHKDFVTCKQHFHHELEEQRNERGKAFFKLW